MLMFVSCLVSRETCYCGETSGEPGKNTGEQGPVWRRRLCRIITEELRRFGGFVQTNNDLMLRGEVPGQGREVTEQNLAPTEMTVIAVRAVTTAADWEEGLELHREMMFCQMDLEECQVHLHIFLSKDITENTLEGPLLGSTVRLQIDGMNWVLQDYAHIISVNVVVEVDITGERVKRIVEITRHLTKKRLEESHPRGHVLIQ